MNETPVMVNEAERLAALYSYDVLYTAAEAEYDALTRLASQICGTSVSLITLIDEKQQWFKSAHGTTIRETPREYAFCNHAIMQPDRPMLVSNLRLDERFTNNPLVTNDPHVVFYASAPLVDSNGFALGTLCVLDTEERQLNDFQLQALQTLARQVMALLQLRRKLKAMQTMERLLNERNDELQAGLETALTLTPLVAKLSIAMDELNQHLTSPNQAGTVIEKAQEYIKAIEENLQQVNKLV